MLINTRLRGFKSMNNYASEYESHYNRREKNLLKITHASSLLLRCIEKNSN
ncbi:hypothetical protein RO3G_10417 [Rhizopus delemar RA 99-880]|uniref:Uncharacterized protein n=1 Tax=Rhizopus delemar (strain RA 99-880 / ATCC MYA-4621 / FGSC 9543 / NRRL 43880) TaxID=246409 RepID=I1CB77_RHIO9|nr:hypothetical protein RO3G_10417 [Rhizopus delemar RA 99-880]|eukprot:EIE85707.1 hypothetical protein RO3G_10417 [Rhizopus delemar RA 99-880]